MPDTFTVKRRYGAEARFPREQAQSQVALLLSELQSEEFEEPDDEHTQVAVSFGEWSLTAQVSGFLTLDDLSWLEKEADPSEMPESRHLRAPSRGYVKELLLHMARGEISDVLAAPWVDWGQVPPFERDLFREG